MWCAAKFGLAYESKYSECEIDIEESDEQRDYDFHLIISEARLPFQLAEVLDHARRRDDEYRKNSVEQIRKRLDVFDARYTEDAISQIRKQLQKKVDKRYANSETLNLLLYLNLKVFDLPWNDIKAATDDLVETFSSVWLITDQFASCLYAGNRWPPIEGWWFIEGSS